MNEVMAMLTVEDALERVLELCAPLPEETVSVDDAVGRALVTICWRCARCRHGTTRRWTATRCARRPRRPTTSADRHRAHLRRARRPRSALEAGTCARIMTGGAGSRRRGRGGDAGASAGPRRGAGRGARGAQARGQHPPPWRGRGGGAASPEGGGAAGAGRGGGVVGPGPGAGSSVRRRPRVAIAASGDELCNAWEEPLGAIVDTNSPVIAQAVKRAGGIPTTLGVAAGPPRGRRRLVPPWPGR